MRNSRIKNSFKVFCTIFLECSTQILIKKVINMFSYSELQNYAVGIPIIIIVVAVFVIGQVLFRRLFYIEKIESCHEVGGVIFQLLGTLYAVILGLIVLDAMAKFEATEMIILNESQSLLVVFELAEQFKIGGKGKVVQQLTEDYIDEVITNDWGFMKDGILNHRAHDILKNLLDEIKKIVPITENEKQLFPTLLQETISIRKYRYVRFSQAENGVPSPEWVMLLIGGVVTIVFTFFFRIENQKIQSLMIGMFALIIIMNLYMVLLFSEPYAGDFVASKKPLITVQRLIKGVFDEHHNAVIKIN